MASAPVFQLTNAPVAAADTTTLLIIGSAATMPTTDTAELLETFMSKAVLNTLAALVPLLIACATAVTTIGAAWPTAIVPRLITTTLPLTL